MILTAFIFITAFTLFVGVCHTIVKVVNHFRGR